VEFLTWIGDDPRGQRIADYLHDSGVRLAPGSKGASRTGTAHAELDEDGSATYTFDLEWVVPSESAPSARPVLHTGSIATALEPGAAGVEALIDAYVPTTTITFDPNIRPEFFASADQALARVESIVSRCDVVKASAAKWLALGPALVAVTLGADGSYAVCADGSERIPAYPTEVVDTVGAGDAFMTGLIDALWGAELLGGDRRDELRRLPAAELRRVLKVAALSSALTVARPGAALPDRATRDRAASRLGEPVR
jgi:fructokinase